MSPHYWPRFLTSCCETVVFSLCVLCGKGQWFDQPSSWNFFQPQTEGDLSGITGVWTPMDETKNVCQRLGDQFSSLRWGLICPREIIGLQYRTGLGVSFLCLDHRLTCSTWHDPGNISLRSRKDYQWLSIKCCLLWIDKTRELVSTRVSEGYRP